jgi:hypothetical protein
VEEFSPEGAFLGQFGSAGTGFGQFASGLAGIARDSQGHLYVAETGGRVDEFTEAGSLITSFGAAGFGEGQFGFAENAGVSTDPHGNIYLADANNHRVQRWFSR